jgi:hypothetical protein
VKWTLSVGHRLRGLLNWIFGRSDLLAYKAEWLESPSKGFRNAGLTMPDRMEILDEFVRQFQLSAAAMFLKEILF